MCMIGEQIKELRNLSETFEEKRLGRILSQAADTIESLSAKLAAANMQRSEAYYNDGWIYCGDKKNLPEEHDSMFAKFKGTDKWNGAMFEKTSDDVNVTVEFEDGKRKAKTLHTIDGKWNGGNRGVKFQVIAWQSLPLEYKGHSAESGDSK